MFGISGMELTLILLFVMIVFGPDKMADLGRTIGKAMGMFKRAQADMERMIKTEIYAPTPESPASESEPAEEVDESLMSPNHARLQAAAIYASTAGSDGSPESDEPAADDSAAAPDTAATDVPAPAASEEVDEG